MKVKKPQPRESRRDREEREQIIFIYGKKVGREELLNEIRALLQIESVKEQS